MPALCRAALSEEAVAQMDTDTHTCDGPSIETYNISEAEGSKLTSVCESPECMLVALAIRIQCICVCVCVFVVCI